MMLIGLLLLPVRVSSDCCRLGPTFEQHWHLGKIMEENSLFIHKIKHGPALQKVMNRDLEIANIDLLKVYAVMFNLF